MNVVATFCPAWLQHDQTLSHSAKGVACETNTYSYNVLCNQQYHGKQKCEPESDIKTWDENK